MLARIFSCAVIGLEGVIVEVEMDTTNGLPGTDIVGLPDKAVQEKLFARAIGGEERAPSLSARAHRGQPGARLRPQRRSHL